MDYDLLAGEEMVASMDNDRVLLSNKRLRIKESGNVKSIALSQISYVESKTVSNYVFLVFAVVGGGISVFLESGQMALILFFLGLVLFAFKKKNFFIVNSSGGSLKHEVSGSQKDISRFIYLVDEQINLNK